MGREWRIDPETERILLDHLDPQAIHGADDGSGLVAHGVGGGIGKDDVEAERESPPPVVQLIERLLRLLLDLDDLEFLPGTLELAPGEGIPFLEPVAAFRVIEHAEVIDQDRLGDEIENPHAGELGTAHHAGLRLGRDLHHGEDLRGHPVDRDQAGVVVELDGRADDLVADGDLRAVGPRARVQGARRVEHPVEEADNLVGVHPSNGEGDLPEEVLDVERRLEEAVLLAGIVGPDQVLLLAQIREHPDREVKPERPPGKRRAPVGDRQLLQHVAMGVEEPSEPRLGIAGGAKAVQGFPDVLLGFQDELSGGARREPLEKVGHMVGDLADRLGRGDLGILHAESPGDRHRPVPLDEDVSLGIVRIVEQVTRERRAIRLME